MKLVQVDGKPPLCLFDYLEGSKQEVNFGKEIKRFCSHTNVTYGTL